MTIGELRAALGRTDGLPAGMERARIERWLDRSMVPPCQPTDMTDAEIGAVVMVMALKRDLVDGEAIWLNEAATRLGLGGEVWHPGPPPVDPDARWRERDGYYHWRPVWVRAAGQPDRVAFWCYHVPEEWETRDEWPEKPRLFECAHEYGDEWTDGALWREVR